MSDMTIQEFASKVVHDKAFRIEVINLCYDYKPAEGEDGNIGQMFNEGAKKMGYEFDEDELNTEIKAQVNTLSGFKKIKFAGSVVNIARKALKAAKAGK